MASRAPTLNERQLLDFWDELRGHDDVLRWVKQGVRRRLEGKGRFTITADDVDSFLQELRSDQETCPKAEFSASLFRRFRSKIHTVLYADFIASETRLLQEQEAQYKTLKEKSFREWLDRTHARLVELFSLSGTKRSTSWQDLATALEKNGAPIDLVKKVQGKEERVQKQVRARARLEEQTEFSFAFERYEGYTGAALKRDCRRLAAKKADKGLDFFEAEQARAAEAVASARTFQEEDPEYRKKNVSEFPEDGEIVNLLNSLFDKGEWRKQEAFSASDFLRYFEDRHPDLLGRFSGQPSTVLSCDWYALTMHLKCLGLEHVLVCALSSYASSSNGTIRWDLLTEMKMLWKEGSYQRNRV